MSIAKSIVQSPDVLLIIRLAKNTSLIYKYNQILALFELNMGAKDYGEDRRNNKDKEETLGFQGTVPSRGFSSEILKEVI